VIKGEIHPGFRYQSRQPGNEIHGVHGVFVPNSKRRVQVTPAKRGTKVDSESPDIDWLDKSPEDRHRAITWMQRLKRVFNIDIEVCEHCGGQVKVIASIEDPKVIELILKHLKHKAAKRRMPPSSASYHQSEQTWQWLLPAPGARRKGKRRVSGIPILSKFIAGATRQAN
jgi:hypothetical protein